MYRTKLGVFQGYKCDTNVANPAIAFLYFQVFLVLTSWVIMSLFIGVISMGMFEAFEKMKSDNKMKKYLAKLEANQANSNKNEKKMKAKEEGALKSAVAGRGGGKASGGGGSKAAKPTVEGKEGDAAAGDLGEMFDAAGELLEEAAEDFDELMETLGIGGKTSLKEKIDYGTKHGTNLKKKRRGRKCLFALLLSSLSHFLFVFLGFAKQRLKTCIRGLCPRTASKAARFKPPWRGRAPPAAPAGSRPSSPPPSRWSRFGSASKPTSFCTASGSRCKKLSAWPAAYRPTRRAGATTARSRRRWPWRWWGKRCSRGSAA
jgi:cell division protein FtsB